MLKYLYNDHSFNKPLLHTLKCCMNALARVKNVVLQMFFFCKILHGIQSGNDDDLDTAGLYISKFHALGHLEELAGSRGCSTGDIVCRFPMKKTGQIYILPLKSF